MNEQIKFLAEQAGFVLWKDESWNPGDVIDWSCRYDDEFEKFAELIVRQCLHKIENEAAQYAEPVWAVELVNDIKEHFGVEE